MWKSLGGFLFVEAVSADLAGMLYIANACGIELHSLEKVDDLTIRFSVSRKDYGKLSEKCRKRGERIRILRYSGLYWKIRQLIKRPVLLAGFLAVFLATYYIPSRILFIEVEGNTQIPTSRITEAADNAGIRFGTSRSMLRSEAVKNKLLMQIPELRWAGVNSRGCVARISVAEQDILQIREKNSSGISNIIAVQDGIVEKIENEQGRVLCEEGQAVARGQVLISGYSELGNCIIGGRAEGEIYARTTRAVEAVTLRKFFQIGRTVTSKKKISAIIGKKRIIFWNDGGIWDASCGRMYKEYAFFLPGGFKLPLSLAIETFCTREIQDAYMPKEEAEEKLICFSESYLKDLMISGVILEKQMRCIPHSEIFLAQGSFACEEMIGREQKEMIGENYVKNS